MKKTFAIVVHGSEYIQKDAKKEVLWHKDVPYTGDVNEAMLFESTEQARVWYEALYEYQKKQATRTEQKKIDDQAGGVSIDPKALHYYSGAGDMLPRFVGRYAYYKKLAELVCEITDRQLDESVDFSNPYVGGLHYLKMGQVRAFEALLREKMGLPKITEKYAGKTDALKDGFDQNYLAEIVLREYALEYPKIVENWKVIVPIEHYREEERFAMEQIIEPWNAKMVRQVLMDEQWVQKVQTQGFELYVVKPKLSVNVQHGFIKVRADRNNDNETVEAIEEATFFTDKMQALKVAEQVQGTLVQMQMQLKGVTPVGVSSAGTKMQALVEKCSLELMQLGSKKVKKVTGKVRL